MTAATATVPHRVSPIHLKATPQTPQTPQPQSRDCKTLNLKQPHKPYNCDPEIPRPATQSNHRPYTYNPEISSPLNPKTPKPCNAFSSSQLWSSHQETSLLSLSASANVCSVRWHPTDAHLLAVGTAAHVVQLFDLRRPSTPLLVFQVRACVHV